MITTQGEIKTLHLKPPIVVRDFAVALGLKPFKLISELNQLVGFAAMNSNIEESVAQKVAAEGKVAARSVGRNDVCGVVSVTARNSPARSPGSPR